MNNIIRKIKKKSIINIILNIILLVSCLIIVTFNFDYYSSILNNKFNYINNIHDLENAYKLNNEIVTLDLTNAKKQHYSINNNELTNTADIYILNLDDSSILILLEPNTIITDKVNLKMISENKTIKNIKNRLNNIDFYDITLTNIDYNFYIKVQIYMVYAIFIIAILSIISTIYNLIKEYIQKSL